MYPPIQTLLTRSKRIFGVDSIDFPGDQLQQGLIGLHKDNVAKIRKGPRLAMIAMTTHSKIPDYFTDATTYSIACRLKLR